MWVAFGFLNCKVTALDLAFFEGVKIVHLLILIFRFSLEMKCLRLTVLKEDSNGRDFIWFEGFENRKKYIYVCLGGISPEMKASKPKKSCKYFFGRDFT